MKVLIPVNRPSVYSQLIIDAIGDTTDTYFSEEVSLGNIPMSILQYVKDLYANPAAEDMFDFVVEDVAVAGTDLDNGNLFEFASFDPCYSPGALSASSDTKGGAVGAVSFCADLSEGVDAPQDDLRYVLIEDNGDPAVPTDIFTEIMGDTTDLGARISTRTIYQLENGAVYITTGRLVNKKEWSLHIEALDLENTEVKPVITRIPNASGSYPDIMRPQGDVTLRNLWIHIRR